MDKLKNWFKNVKLWQLGLAFVISIPISAYLLRQNNLGMVERRDAVILADETTGDINKVEPSLIELRDYVSSHMNTDLGQPLELPGSYNTAVKEIQKNFKDPTVHRAYRKGEIACNKPSVPLNTQAQCIQDYVLNHGGSAARSLAFPPKEQFTYSFVSPAWSLDLAGLSVMITVLLGALIIGQLIAEFAAPRVFKSLSDDDLE